MSNLENFLRPKSVALVGVSRNPNSWGYTVLQAILKQGFNGKIFPINPATESILGVKCYESLSKIDADLDLIVVLTSKEKVADVVMEAADRGAKSAIVVTAGFESREEDRRIQTNMVENVRKRGMRILGPNCLGVFHAPSNLNLTTDTEIPTGDMALISQSGNVAYSLFGEARRIGAGFNSFISMGNQADLTLDEWLPLLNADQGVKAILIFIEGLKDGRRFIQEAAKVVREKPVLVMKAGMSVTGTRAASTHTGSMTGSDEVYEGAFKQFGILRVKESRDLVSIGNLLSHSPLPKGNNIVVLTDGGGQGTIAADVAEEHGLVLPGLLPATRTKLGELLRPWASTVNPVDVVDSIGNDQRLYVDICSVLLADPACESLIILGGFGSNYFGNPFDVKPTSQSLEIGRKIFENAKLLNKPIIFQSIAAAFPTIPLIELKRLGATVFDFPEDAIKAAGALFEYKQLRDIASEIHCEDAFGLLPTEMVSGKNKKQMLTEPEAKFILTKYGIESPPFFVALTEEDAVKAAQQIDFPVVLKAVSKDITHKSRYGLVRLDINNEQSVRKEYKYIIKTVNQNKYGKIDGVLVTAQRPRGLEMIVGTKRDPIFGSVILVGLGGVFAEEMHDIVLRILPVRDIDIRLMLESLRGYERMKRRRSLEADLVKPMAKLVKQMSQLIIGNPTIEEIDLNPVILHRGRFEAVDARILVTDMEES